MRWIGALVVACLLTATPALAGIEFKEHTFQSAAGATGNGTALSVQLYNSLAVQIVISATATVSFESTVDDSNWVALACTSIGSTSGTLVTSAANSGASGVYQCNVAGLSKVRMRISSFGSGTVTVYGKPTTAVLGKKGGGGGGSTIATSEADGAPAVAATDTVIFPNGSLTDNGDGSVTASLITPAGVETFSTGTKTVTSKFDFGGGTLELPNSNTLPATCVVGEFYVDANATSGQRLYLCESANTWALQGDGTGGLSSHSLLSATHSDTVAASPTLGDLQVGNVSSLWTVLAGSTSATQKCMKQTGTGAASALPVWDSCGAVNAQTGTTYTVLASDNTKLITVTNASPVEVTLPAAGGTGFAAGFMFFIENRGAGTVNLDPATSTIDGAADLDLTTNQGICVFSDGTNYFTGCRGTGSGTTYTAGDNLDDSSNTFHYTAIDPSTVQIYEEFFSGSNTTGQIGHYGWMFTNIGAAPTIGKAVATVPNLGQVSMTTTATSGQGGSFSLGDNTSGFGALGNLTANTSWEAQWIFKISSTSDIRFRIGLAVSGATGGDVEPPDGIWLRYDTEATYSDTAFNFICRSGSSNTTAAPTGTMTAGTTFFRLKISSTVAGTVNFQLYDATGSSLATGSCASGTPTASLVPRVTIATNTTAAKIATMDLFAFKMRGLSR